MFWKRKLKTFSTNSCKSLKYAHIIIKSGNEEVTDKAFVNNSMHLKSSYSETKTMGQCTIITVVVTLKFLRFFFSIEYSVPFSSFITNRNMKRWEIEKSWLIWEVRIFVGSMDDIDARRNWCNEKILWDYKSNCHYKWIL